MLEIFDEAFYQNIWGKEYIRVRSIAILGVEKGQEANAEDKMGDSQAFIDHKIVR